MTLMTSNNKKGAFLYRLLFVFAMLTSFAYAEIVTNTHTRTIEGVGIGTSRTDAVNQALAEGMGQLNGVEMTKHTLVEDISVESSDGDKARYTYNGSIEKITSGKVDSYSILDVVELGDGRYEATVSITKTKTTKAYKTPGHDPKQRRALAVVPSYSGADSFQVLGARKSARDVSQRLTQELVSALTKTRKFSILDREANQAYQDEKALLLSRDAGQDELLKLGNVLGADYLFVSNVTEFRVYHNVETVQVTGQQREILKAYATVQYRILAMATRQVKWASTTTFEFEPTGRTHEQVYLEVLQKISDDLTYEIIENIYPLRIADISAAGEAILSQGIPVGTRYEVFSLGKKLYDPYTNEYLGQDEQRVGEIEIIRSLPKISYGKVISGQINQGDICRRVGKNNLHGTKTPDLTEADKPSDVKQNEGGGVTLPFD